MQGQVDESTWVRKLGPGRAALPLSPSASPNPPSPCRFWFRLYWFPLKVLYATCHCSLRSVPDIPFYFFFNALLLLLTAMNLYWFLVSQPSALLLSQHTRPGSHPGPSGGWSQAQPGRGMLAARNSKQVQRASGRSTGPSGGWCGREGLFSHPCLPLPQYIVAFAAKVLTGQVRELKDVREYDAAEAPSPKPSKAE